MEETLEETREDSNKIITFSKYSLWRLLAYFIIYSIMGLIIETIFAAISYGDIESRKSMLYGPFSSIYGLGAVFMILALQYFKKNKITLFLGGFLVGSILEYLVSFVADKWLHVQWWNYSYMPFNIDGRICLAFSVLWGILAVLLMLSVNPRVDRMIDFFNRKIGLKIVKIIIVFISVFMVLDILVTQFALSIITIRLANEYNLELRYPKNSVSATLYKNEEIKNIADRVLTNKKILMTFPNLKVIKNDGEVILVRDILTDINPYYYKLNISPIDKTI